MLGIRVEAVYRRVHKGRLWWKHEGRRLFVKVPPPEQPEPALPPLDPAMLGVGAVAEILGTTTSFVIDQAKAGKLPAQRRGRFWYVHPDDVATFIESCRVVPKKR